MSWIQDLLVKNGLVVAFLATGVLMLLTHWLGKRFTGGRIPGSAIAIFCGLVLAYLGGRITGGKKGIADIPGLSGFSLMGGAMFRDFTIVATAMGASLVKIRQAGLAGAIALLLGILVAFIFGAGVAIAMGYRDAVSITTIGGGACTFIIGPVTGGALGASSEVITISIAAGLVKSILVTIATPMVAQYIGLNNSKTAMIYGGLIGTTSGVAAGLAATDPKLVPYGALTATFYTGLGCLLCPSILYLLVGWIYS